MTGRVGPELLRTDHALEGFDCGDTTLNWWLINRNQPDPLPAVLLGRLAVDVKHQGQGLGAALLKHFILKSLEVAEITGVRLLLVHAKDDTAASFFRHHGFESSPIDELTLMLLLKDISR